MSRSNQYDPDKHEDYITCPRSRCAVRNAPKESDEFRFKCWKCDARLPVESEVKVGDEITVEVFDIHGSGAGVGRLESGFIVLVDGALPEGTFKVRITTVKDSFARAELLEKVSDEIESTDEDEEEDDEDGRLGSRENHWGR